MSIQEIEALIIQTKNLLKEADDIDEMVEYDNQLNDLYIQLESEKQKEFAEILRQKNVTN